MIWTQLMGQAVDGGCARRPQWPVARPWQCLEVWLLAPEPLAVGHTVYKQIALQGVMPDQPLVSQPGTLMELNNICHVKDG